MQRFWKCKTIPLFDGEIILYENSKGKVIGIVQMFKGVRT
jgi:hypothetical protein